MCLSPIKIKNPNYFRGFRPHRKGGTIYDENPYSYLKDTTSQYIYVPCGSCPQCLSFRQEGFVQRIELEAKDSWMFFFTLTYNEKSLCNLDCDGELYQYADVSDVQNCLKRLRKSGILPSLKYLVVSEYGEKKHRPHWHGLLFVPKCSGQSKFYGYEIEKNLQNWFKSPVGWSRCVMSGRYPVYQPICDFVKLGNHSSFDLHLVTYSHLDSSDESNVYHYVTKYLLKPDKWLSDVYLSLKYKYLPNKDYKPAMPVGDFDDEVCPDYVPRCNPDEPDYFDYVWSRLRPRCLVSKNLGTSRPSDVKDMIQRSLDTSDDFPKFYHQDGSVMPLCGYLRKKFLSISQRNEFFIRNHSPFDDNYNELDQDVYNPDIQGNKRNSGENRINRIKNLDL